MVFLPKEFKTKLLDLIIIEEVLECEDLNREVQKLEDLEKVRRYY